MEKLRNLPVWPIWLLLTLGFLGNLGVHKIHFSSEGNEKLRKLTPVELRDRMHAVDSFANSKVKEAETKIKRGKDYTSFDYFKDYGDIDLFAKSLGVPSGNGFVYLQEYHHQWLTRGGPQKAKLALLDSARNMCFDRTDPGWRERERLSRADPPITWDIFFSWLTETLTKQYLRNFILGFIALLLFKYKSKEEKRFSFRNPLGFIICLIFYPITIIYFLRLKWSSILDEAEIRSRREKLFSMISSDELAIISTLRSKLSLHGAQDVLDLAGATRKYSLISVLLAMCIMSFLPKPSLGREVRSDDKRETIHAIKMEQTDHPVVVIPNILVKDYPVMELSKSLSLENLFGPLIVYLKTSFHFLLLKGVRRAIDPIPLSTLAFRILY